MFLRLLIFASMVAMVAGFFFPYFDISINNKSIFAASGFDMISQSSDQLGALSMQEKLYLLIVPVTGLWCLLAFFKKWHSVAYWFVALLALGGLGYLLYENYSPIKQTLDTLSQSTGLLNAMAEVADSPFKLGINTFGLGIYLQAGGLLLTIILGIKDPLNKLRQKPQASPAKP